MDVIQQIAEEAAVIARLGLIFPPGEVNAAMQRIIERDRRHAKCVASVWMSIASVLSDEDAEN